MLQMRGHFILSKLISLSYISLKVYTNFGILPSEKTRKGNALLRTTLITCAHATVKNKKSYFDAQFMRISAHQGCKHAYVAIAHSMLIVIYHILKDGIVFKDLVADYYNQFNKERKINAYLKKLKALGWKASVAAA